MSVKVKHVEQVADKPRKSKSPGRRWESRYEPGPRAMIAAVCRAPCAMQRRTESDLRVRPL